MDNNNNNNNDNQMETEVDIDEQNMIDNSDDTTHAMEIIQTNGESSGNNVKRKKSSINLSEQQMEKMLKRGLRGNEDSVMSEINYMLKHEVITEERTVFPSEDVPDLNSDEMRLLFSRFSFRGQIVLSLVCPQWKLQLDDMFAKQSYLWFCCKEEEEEEVFDKRFYPLCDCCSVCEAISDDEPCIKLAVNDVMSVVRDVLSFTPNLKCLRLYRFTISDPLVFTYLSHICPKLVHLDLSECHAITDAVATQLAKSYPKLLHLILASTKITEQQLSTILEYCDQLVTLVLNRTLIDGQCLRSLPRSLQRLDLRCCAKLKYRHMKEFANMITEFECLTHLRIDFGINEQIIRSICHSLNRQLRVFDLDFQLNVLSVDIRDIASLTQLKVLKIGSGIVFVAKNNFKRMMECCTQMEYFSLTLSSRWDHIGIADTHLSLMHNYWPRLQRLDLISIHFNIDSTIESLTKFKHLSHIDLTDCCKLSDTVVRKVFPETRCSLNFIVFDKCSELSKVTIDAMISKAERMDERDMLYVSMIACNLKVMPYLRGISFPRNLVISFSNKRFKRYCTFDGQRCKYGNLYDIRHN